MLIDAVATQCSNRSNAAVAAAAADPHLVSLKVYSHLMRYTAMHIGLLQRIQYMHLKVAYYSTIT